MCNDVAVSLSPSPEALVSALEKNVFAAFSLLGASSRKSTLWESEKLIRYSTDLAHPMANVVIQTTLSDKGAADTVQEILGQYKARKQSLMWFINPSSEPSHLAEILYEAGAVETGSTPGMAAKLDSIADQIHIPNGLTLVEATTPEAVEEWCQTCTEAFSLPDEIGEMVADVSRKHGYGAMAPWRNFSAIRDGHVVATASLFVHDGIAGIFCVATLSEARRKGVGAAVTQMTMLEGKAAGCDWAILQSSSDGFPLYEKLGFRTICKFRRFIYTPE